MIRNYPTSVLLFCLSLCCSTTTAQTIDESAEPSLKYSLTVGDKTTTLSENEPIQIDGNFSNPTVTLKPHAHRTFSFQGIKFDYPRSFMFEADLQDPTNKIWTLSGNSFVVMYFTFPTSISTEEFAEEMIVNFGKDNVKTKHNSKITLGKQELAGTSLLVSLANQKMTMDIYRVPTENATTKLLVFQDSLDESGNGTSEALETLKQIKTSFAIEQYCPIKPEFLRN